MNVLPIIAAMLLGFSAQLSRAAGFPVSCQPVSQYGYDGFVGGVALLEQRAIVLSPSTCRGFGQRRYMVDSVVTLGHERAHLLGIADERQAELKGYRDAPWLGRRLHLRVTRSMVDHYRGRTR